MDLPVLDGKKEQGGQVSSGTGMRAVKRISETTESRRLVGAGHSEPCLTHRT